VDGQAKVEAFITSTQAVRTYYEMGPTAELFDENYPAYVNFDLGDAIQRVQSVILKFKVDAFLSTVKTVTNGALTINAASGNTGTGGVHSHQLILDNSTAGAVVWLSGSAPGSLRAAGGGYVLTGNSSSHTHDLSHGHTGSSNVSVGMGLLAQGPTATSSYWSMTVNGGNATNSITGPDANGYYSLDLTPDVSNTTTLRPSQVAHQVSLIALPGYFGLLRARIQVRAFV